jgi:exodeoxyribonuclease VII small subunit
VATREEPPSERYSDVVDRLEEVVKKLEGGQVSLKDSLEEFEKGIQLVKRGERSSSRPSGACRSFWSTRAGTGPSLSNPSGAGRRSQLRRPATMTTSRSDAR